MSNLSDNVGEERSYLVTDSQPDPPRSPNPTIFEKANINISETLSNTQSTASSFDSNENPNSRTSNAQKSSKKSKSKKSKSNTSAPINLMIVNSKDINVGPSIKHVYNLNNIQNHYEKNASPENNANESKHMPPCIKELSSSNVEITIEDMLLIKMHIGSGWNKVAKKIGYSKGQREQFLDKYKYKDEIMYQILLDWKQACTKNATVGRLITALWLAQEYDCAEIFATTHSSHSNLNSN